MTPQRSPHRRTGYVDAAPLLLPSEPPLPSEPLLPAEPLLPSEPLLPLPVSLVPVVSPDAAPPLPELPSPGRPVVPSPESPPLSSGGPLALALAPPSAVVPPAPSPPSAEAEADSLPAAVVLSPEALPESPTAALVLTSVPSIPRQPGAHASTTASK